MNEDYSSRPHTIAEGGKRVWIYPQEISGKYAKIRVAIAVPLVVFFYLLPWLKWNNNPILRLSLSAKSFFFLGQPILIYEFYHFVFLFILAILTLFLISSLWGRVWCGYGCPQTIFIEQILRRIERLIEGPASHQKILASKKMTLGTFFKKFLKQFIFFLISLSFGFTAVSFFVDPKLILTFSSTSSIVMVILLTAMAWFDGAYWREQFCHMVCPYARFQSVMISRESTTIGFDNTRGEPRKKGKNREGAGDCIDCGLCVRVCPAGIDIRQGPNQLECIACTRCIDACDSIMASIEKPKGLIRYETEIGLENKEIKYSLIQKISRPKNLFLLIACILLFGIGLLAFINRQQYHVQMLTVPGLPFVSENQRIKNIYTFKIGNQSNQSTSFFVELKNLESGKIESPTTLGTIFPGEEKIIPFLFSFDKNCLEKFVTIVIKTKSGEVVVEKERQLLKPGS